MWIDWAIFESFVWQIFVQKWPKYLVILGYLEKHKILSHVKIDVSTFWQLL